QTLSYTPVRHGPSASVDIHQKCIPPFKLCSNTPRAPLRSRLGCWHRVQSNHRIAPAIGWQSEPTLPGDAPGFVLRTLRLGSRRAPVFDHPEPAMIPKTHRRVVLVRRPPAEPTEADFRIEEVPVPEPGPREFLARVVYLSLDPYKRGRMRDAASYAAPVGIGQVMPGGTGGEVD